MSSNCEIKTKTLNVIDPGTDGLSDSLCRNEDAPPLECSNLQGNNIRYFLVIMFRHFERYLYIVTIIRYELNYFYIYRMF